MTLRRRIVDLARRGLRPVLCALGVVLMLISPLAGILPGPGGILVFAIGLGMVLRTSFWARRRYARALRHHSRIRGWVDWGMRRPSARRRRARAKAAGGAVRLTPPPTLPNRRIDPVVRATGGLLTLKSEE